MDINIRHKRIQTQDILGGIRKQISRGEIIALVGASGCGKSTLLRVICGLERGYDGTITLEGSPVRGLTRDIGLIFQEPRLFPWLTVSENMAFDMGRTLRKQPEVVRRIEMLLKEMGLTERADSLPKQLSGGQAQRAAIARGLFRQPKLLLLDEPFSAVDAFTRMRLQDLLQTVASHRQTTLLMVTHDIDEAVYLADRVWVMDSHPGRISAEVRVDLPHPRRRDSFEMASYRNHVLHLLNAAQAI